MKTRKNTNLSTLTYFICFIIFINIFLCSVSVSAAEKYTCNSFSVNVPTGFRVDDKTIDDYVSFYGENVTIGISIESNLKQENVSVMTESDISDIISDTVSLLSDKAGNGVTDAKHEIISFSNNNYPALYVLYTGSNDIQSEVYIEEYIVTTEEYKYTIVISASNEKDLVIEGIDDFTDSFTAFGHPMSYKDKEPTDRRTLLIIFIVALVIVLIGGFFAIRYFIKHKPADTKPAAKTTSKKKAKK